MVQIWDGIYSRWSEAVDAAKTGDEPVFTSDEWLRKVVAQLLDYRERLAAGETTLPPRPSNLPLVSSLVEPNTIVDLGGSSGWCWEYLKDSVPTTSLKHYQVVETETIVDFFERSGHHADPVTYHRTTKGLGDCDLLYANSVLQYFPSNDDLIEALNDVSARFVLLDDLFAGNNPEFFSVQNYYGKKIPCRFLNSEKLDGELRREGYTLVAKLPFDTPTLGVSQTKPMDNFPFEYRLSHSVAALYRRAT